MIHPTAIVSDRAEIGPGTEVGAYSIIEGEVSIGADTVVESHVRIGSRFGRVTIGEKNYIQNGAALGGPPQDSSYDFEPTELSIGNRNRIGEYTTINLGSAKSGLTRIGNGTFIMGYVHVAHDCVVEDDVVLTNLVQLAGHSTVEQGAILGGRAAVAQFARVGRYAFIGTGVTVNKDILPYSIAAGDRWATLRATNKIGLKRAGFSEKEIREIDKAVRIVRKRDITMEEAARKIRDCNMNEHIEHLLRFLKTSEKGLARA